MTPEEIFNYIRDTDGDSLIDGIEWDIGTNPYSVDTDNDGFSDYLEYRHGKLFGYDPLKPTKDSDLDGLSDSLEELIGTNPYFYDTDRDGFGDLDEYMCSFMGYDPKTHTDEKRDLKEGVLRENLSNYQKRILSEHYPQGCTPSDIPEGDFLLPFLRNGKIRPSLGLLSLSFCFFDSLYHTYDEFVQEIAQLYQSNTDIVKIFRFDPPTYDGHRIWALKISDNPNSNEDEVEILVLGNHHARELISAEAPLYWLNRLVERYRGGDPKAIFEVQEREIWLIPMLNPDGHFMCENNYNWRKNTHWYPELGQDFETRGVDLNRNYPEGWEENPDPNSNYWSGPFALSEIEDSAVYLLSLDKDLVDHFDYSISFHSWIQGEWGHQYSWVLTPNFSPLKPVRENLGRACAYLTKFSNMPRPPYHFSWELSNGTHEAFQIVNGTLAFLVELFGVQNEGEPSICLPYPCDTMINPFTELTYERTMLNASELIDIEATLLKGELRGDLNLNFPVYLSGDLLVPDSVTLTLLSGAQVNVIPKTDEMGSGKDTSKVELIVKGKLVVNGGPMDPIVFSSFTESESDSDWYGIVVKEGGELIVRNAWIKNCLYGIKNEGGSVTVEDSKISENKLYGIFSKGDMEVKGTYFKDNGRGSIYGTEGVVKVENSHFKGEEDVVIELHSTDLGSFLGANRLTPSKALIGIRIDSCAFLEICDNRVENVSECALDIVNCSPYIHRNQFSSEEGVGILVEGGSPGISRNVFLGFNIPVKVIRGAHPILGRMGDPQNPGENSFRDYGSYAVEYNSLLPGDSIFAENNYWGSPLPSDSIFVGNVDYIPWLSRDPFSEIKGYVEKECEIPKVVSGYMEIETRELLPKSIRIYDVTGRIVLERNFEREKVGDKVRVGMGSLNSGVYFYIVEGVKGRRRGTFLLIK